MELAEETIPGHRIRQEDDFRKLVTVLLIIGCFLCTDPNHFFHFLHFHHYFARSGRFRLSLLMFQTGLRKNAETFSIYCRQLSHYIVGFLLMLLLFGHFLLFVLQFQLFILPFRRFSNIFLYQNVQRTSIPAPF